MKVIATKSGNPDLVGTIRTSYARARRAEMIAELDRIYPQESNAASVDTD
jgi:hypothetical protein